MPPGSGVTVEENLEAVIEVKSVWGDRCGQATSDRGGGVQKEKGNVFFLENFCAGEAGQSGTDDEDHAEDFTGLPAGVDKCSREKERD